MKIIQLQLCEFTCYEYFYHTFTNFANTNFIINCFILHTVVLICCQYAVSDLLTDLGSNVIINCDLDENEVYWILLKTPDPPTVILRSLSTTTSPFYHDKTFRKKYSVQFKHRLVINNVTAYYCMNTAKQQNSATSSEYTSLVSSYAPN